MYMRFGPWSSRAGSGEYINCDLCRRHNVDIAGGFFRCRSRFCDYDVCRDCGLANGGIEVQPPDENTFKCQRGHPMAIQFAPEPYQVRRGRSIYCDLCRRRIASNFDEGYFRCGCKHCNYDVCRTCGIERGGIDTDLEVHVIEPTTNESALTKAQK